MTRKYGRIAMQSEDFPVQHLHAVVDFPPCPPGFEIETPIGCDPDTPFDVIEHPESMKTIAVLEWAWSPMHSRIDTYLLERRAEHWALWNYLPEGLIDEDEHHLLMAYGPPLDMPERTAAMHLLRASLAAERDDLDVELDRPFLIDHVDLLSIGDLKTIFREVWPLD